MKKTVLFESKSAITFALFEIINIIIQMWLYKDYVFFCVSIDAPLSKNI